MAASSRIRRGSAKVRDEMFYFREWTRRERAEFFTKVKTDGDAAQLWIVAQCVLKGENDPTPMWASVEALLEEPADLADELIVPICKLGGVDIEKAREEAAAATEGDGGKKERG